MRAGASQQGRLAWQFQNVIPVAPVFLHSQFPPSRQSSSQKGTCQPSFNSSWPLLLDLLQRQVKDIHTSHILQLQRAHHTVNSVLFKPPDNPDNWALPAHSHKRRGTHAPRAGPRISCDSSLARYCPPQQLELVLLLLLLLSGSWRLRHVLILARLLVAAVLVHKADEALLGAGALEVDNCAGRMGQRRQCRSALSVHVRSVLGLS